MLCSPMVSAAILNSGDDGRAELRTCDWNSGDDGRAELNGGNLSSTPLPQLGL
jgi:hypothetical protein